MLELSERDFMPELEFVTSRSGGAGGQNVNKVSTKVELRFHVQNSALLSDVEKERVLEKAKNNISKEGILQIVSQEARSQLRNKQLCIEKFYQLLENALRKPKRRKATKPTKGSVINRLLSKRKSSEKKAMRRKDNH